MKTIIMKIVKRVIGAILILIALIIPVPPFLGISGMVWRLIMSIAGSLFIFFSVHNHKGNI